STRLYSMPINFPSVHADLLPLISQDFRHLRDPCDTRAHPSCRCLALDISRLLAQSSALKIRAAFEFGCRVSRQMRDCPSLFHVDFWDGIVLKGRRLM